MSLNLDYLLDRLWEYLALLRVYTKRRGGMCICVTKRRGGSGYVWGGGMWVCVYTERMGIC